MNKYTRLLPVVAFLFSAEGLLMAQTPTDAVMMKQREACLAVIYDYGSFDEYWEGTNLRTNATIATVRRTTVMPMIAIGILDNLNLIVSTPYVRTKSEEPNGGKLQGAKGFQDLGLVLKYRFLNLEMEGGKLALVGAAGYSTPMTNYLSDYLPYSLGFGAPEVSGRAIVQYEWNNGLYARGSFAYLWRGETEAERDYYYNNGSYYTAWMDVPNAINFQLVAGKWFLDHSFHIEVAYNSTKCLTGDDIRPYNAAQPTNKVEVGQAGVNAQYFFPNIKGFGVLANYSQIISGRNMAKYRNIGVGLTYQFKF
ncbi:MAG TPA: transporter [Cyclobacteriaceae bacterium]